MLTNNVNKEGRKERNNMQKKEREKSLTYGLGGKREKKKSLGRKDGNLINQEIFRPQY